MDSQCLLSRKHIALPSCLKLVHIANRDFDFPIEVYFRDSAHGLLVWAVGMVITARFLTSSAALFAGDQRNAVAINPERSTLDPTKAKWHLRLLFVHIKSGESRLFTLCHRPGKKSTLLLGVCKVRARVLIVDDHAIIRKMLHALFEAHDMEVCEAENGAEGVQKAQDLNPGLVILDLSMPVMNGLEAARALQLALPRVPLLMFTNNNVAAMEKEARSAGIFAVISKSDANASRQLVAHAKALLRLDGADVQFVS